ncbi:MAG: hypothetical protein BWK73_04840 [Thiothrix lacustris]|uniref:KilA-N domain-containing protein n=1 Tax=Thiothrix lacustris TaxID=525917 RepID=A0A1Y1QXL4_9GAMM|nr:MAG: hypothetical protein BWK73_04840 [Thiothrix lacustris]
MATTNLITHEVQSVTVLQRESDGYFNATKLSQAAGKRLNNYIRNDTTEAFLKALEAETRISASELIQVVKGGNGTQGTWVHPQIAMHLAQWLSAEYAVKVSKWVYDWMSQGKQPDPEFLTIHKSVLQDTGRALVWMGDYGVTSQPFYGNAGQPPFVDGRPVMAIGDSSTRYYLTKYVGNVMESQTIATEECLTRHIRAQFPEVDVIVKEDMRHNLMSLATQLTTLSGQFITSAEINKGLGKAMATRA